MNFQSPIELNHTSSHVLSHAFEKRICLQLYEGLPRQSIEYAEFTLKVMLYVKLSIIDNELLLFTRTNQGFDTQWNLNEFHAFQDSQTAFQ